jgi:hypothetical protein
MRYTLDNGKSVNIPKSEIEKLMSSLELSEKDAIDLWLCDNNLEEDEEQTELDEKASKVRIDKDIIQKKPKKERKKPEKKVSDAKKELFSEILSDLEDVYKGNVEVLNENKLISVRIGEKLFKIDVIETRPPKK